MITTLDFFSGGTHRFLNFMPFILKWECDWPNKQDGQYEKDPDDPGGATKWGIDARSHPDHDIKNLSLNQAVQIYYEKYWLKNNCESLPLGMGEVYMNACVNCGSKRAVFWRMPHADGSPVTDYEFLDRQEAYYRHLADEHAQLAKFLKGWLNRTSDLRTWLSSHVGQSASLSSQAVPS